MLALSTVLVALAGAAEAASPPGWSEPVEIDTLTEFGNSPSDVSTAVDHNGRILAAWSTYIGDTGWNAIGYAWYEPGEGWGPSEYIYSYWADLVDPSVAAFPNGSFVLVYSDRDTDGWVNGPTVWSRMWEPQTGWDYQRQVNNNNVATDVYASQVGVDGTGSAVAAWLSWEGTYWNLTANRYVPGSGWGASYDRLENANFNIPGFDLGVDRTGNAIVAWYQADGSGERAYATRYVAGSGWTSAGVIDVGDYDVDNVQVAVDESGNAVVLIDQSNGTIDRIYANRYTVGAGWSGVTPLSLDNGYGPNNPSVASVGTASFVATWSQWNGTDWNVYSAVYGGGNWAAATDLTDTDLGMEADDAIVVASSPGSALATWWQYTDVDQIRWNTFASWWTSAGGWTAPVQIGFAPEGAWPMAASCSSAGDCVVAMPWGDGLRERVWVTTYMPPDVTAPILVIGAPTSGSSSSNSTIWVSGGTDPDTSVVVVVNGIRANVDAMGGFSVPLALVPGDNVVNVAAWDTAGNTAYASVTVTYNDPVPGLEAELTAAQGGLATTQAQLTTTQGNLASAQAQLTAANADITALETDLAATKTAQTASDASQTTSINAAASAAGTASMLGILGILIGLAGIAMGFMMSRKGSGGAKPAESKPAEPPKAP